MNDNELLALMYDFYNDCTLRGQNDDINYYIKQIEFYKAKNVLIIGAGTGRVAIPLSKYAQVTALDMDLERLNLLKKKTSNINVVCCDFINYNPIKKDFDLIIVPYSTLQFSGDKNKFIEMIKQIYKICNEKTIVLFDLSESFNKKPEIKEQLLFTKEHSELKEQVEVYYTSIRKSNYIEFIIKYHLVNSQKIVIEKEKYLYYDEYFVLNTLNNLLSILKIDDGYGAPGFEHKHVFHCKK